MFIPGIELSNVKLLGDCIYIFFFYVCARAFLNTDTTLPKVPKSNGVGDQYQITSVERKMPHHKGVSGLAGRLSIMGAIKSIIINVLGVI